MRCLFVATDTVHPRFGREWRCVNKTCGHRCYGDRPANCERCRSDGSAKIPTEFADLPCTLRANVRDVEIPSGCCGGTALVEVADCPRGKCTMRGVGGTVACVGCAMRV